MTIRALLQPYFASLFKLQLSHLLFHYSSNCKPLLTNCPHNCGQRYSEPAIRCLHGYPIVGTLNHLSYLDNMNSYYCWVRGKTICHSVNMIVRDFFE